MIESAEEKMVRETVKNLVTIAGRSGQHLYEEFEKQMRQEHRTNQQLIGGLIFSYIKNTGDKYDMLDLRPKYFDGRNEAFGMRCSRISATANEYSPYWNLLPYI